MKDYTAYMLAEILKGTFKAYGSAYGHGVSGVNLGAKTGTGTYGAEIYQQYNLPDSAAKDVWINGFSPQYTMSVWMGFNKVKQYGTNSFVGHSQQEYPQYLFQDVMSDISSKDGEDFKKPKDVNGSDGDNLSVAGHLTITLRTAVFTEIAILLLQVQATVHHQALTVVQAILTAHLKVAQVMH